MDLYEQLWREARPAFERGQPLMDANLCDKTRDPRRGVTLVLRPSIAVQARVKDFSDQLAAAFPAQYFYQPEELHVTVISIISGTAFWRKEIGALAFFRSLLRDILSRHRSFELVFRGVTATSGAVLIQGFPLDDRLAKIREEIRKEFARNGFSSQLDRRYSISGAHMSLMRFRQPQDDWNRLAARLKESRQTDFGETKVDSLQLIWGIGMPPPGPCGHWRNTLWRTRPIRLACHEELLYAAALITGVKAVITLLSFPPARNCRCAAGSCQGCHRDNRRPSTSKLILANAKNGDLPPTKSGQHASRGPGNRLSPFWVSRAARASLVVDSGLNLLKILRNEFIPRLAAAGNVVSFVGGR